MNDITAAAAPKGEWSTQTEPPTATLTTNGFASMLSRPCVAASTALCSCIRPTGVAQSQWRVNAFFDLLFFLAWASVVTAASLSCKGCEWFQLRIQALGFETRTTAVTKACHVHHVRLQLIDVRFDIDTDRHTQTLRLSAASAHDRRPRPRDGARHVTGFLTLTVGNVTGIRRCNALVTVWPGLMLCVTRATLELDSELNMSGVWSPGDGSTEPQSSKSCCCLRCSYSVLGCTHHMWPRCACAPLDSLAPLHLSSK